MNEGEDRRGKSLPGVAAAELEAIDGRINGVLTGKAELDNYTRFHLSADTKADQEGARRAVEFVESVREGARGEGRGVWAVK
jgi:hypothetical protein